VKRVIKTPVVAKVKHAILAEGKPPLGDGGGGVVASLTLSTIVTSTNNATADGVATATVLITLNDDTGTPIPNEAFTIALTGTGSAVVGTIPATTDGSGQMSIDLTDSTAEALTVGFTINGDPEDSTTSVTFQQQITHEHGSNGNGYAWTVKSGTDIVCMTQYGFETATVWTNPRTKSYPIAFRNGADTANASPTSYMNMASNRSYQMAFDTTPGATSAAHELRNINNDALNDDAFMWHASRFNNPSGVGGQGNLSSTIGFEYGTGGDGSYIRYFERSSGNNIIVLQAGSKSIATSGTISLAYNHGDTNYAVMLAPISGDTGVGRQYQSKTNTAFTAKCYRIEGGGTSGRTRTYGWTSVWIRNANTDYGRIQIGTSSDKRWCEFKDTNESTIDRLLQYELSLSNGTSSPPVSYPRNQNQTGTGTNYFLGGNVFQSATRGYGCSAFNNNTAKSTTAWELEGYNEVVQTLTHSWITDSIRAGTL
jgi:hypothetical protein